MARKNSRRETEHAVSQAIRGRRRRQERAKAKSEVAIRQISNLTGCNRIDQGCDSSPQQYYGENRQDNSN